MSIRLNHLPPLTPFRGPSTCARSRPSVPPRASGPRTLSGLFSPCGHCRRFGLPSVCSSRIHLPVPLRSTPVTALLATMGTLTPRAGLPPDRGLPASRHTSVSDHSASNHPTRPHHRFHTLPLSSMGLPLTRVQASPLASRLAGTPGRIEFVILRTGLSPPVAPHPASRRRSYLRLQAGERMPGEDLHLYTCALAGALARVFRPGRRRPRTPN